MNPTSQDFKLCLHFEQAAAVAGKSVKAVNAQRPEMTL